MITKSAALIELANSISKDAAEHKDRQLKEKEIVKTASANSLIQTEIGKLLTKLAEELRKPQADINYNDLRDFINDRRA